MYEPKKVTLIFTKHAVHRIYERGYCIEELLRYLDRNKLAFIDKNKCGFEIPIPMKGRLVGDFEGEGSFIVKSFLYPKLSAKPSYRKYIPVVIKHVRLPNRNIPAVGFLR